MFRQIFASALVLACMSAQGNAINLQTTTQPHGDELVDKSPAVKPSDVEQVEAPKKKAQKAITDQAKKVAAEAKAAADTAAAEEQKKKAAAYKE